MTNMLEKINIIRPVRNKYEGNDVYSHDILYTKNPLYFIPQLPHVFLNVALPHLHLNLKNEYRLPLNHGGKIES